MKPGIFLQSTDLLIDTFFDKALIFITEYNEKGAMGFVVNKEFARKFNELEEFKHNIPYPLYEGGPVDQEHLFFLHRRPDLIKGGELVSGNTYVGGDFQEAAKLISNRTLTQKDLRLFIGYCGWDHQELEAEIAEGSWIVLEEASLFD
ncbi:YqgE/AlgH family protein [Paraflavitalea sp. CAU 1676]|uniref:YqgE/AlgH family protein n=1 Tax=Paraflavitalea sp. CAU 1676 TaxID=3032598 RepID=UPI0023DABF3A|nr:YqgE/AlgH family protein [Paraflavitalea sp. CAU 1676]MDF2192780.1 YqgE/AlgH family protein [Paraflavitalea sp. CAU 1676]